MYVESPYADLFPVFLTFLKIIYYKKYPDALLTLYILEQINIPFLWDRIVYWIFIKSDQLLAYLS